MFHDGLILFQLAICDTKWFLVKTADLKHLKIDIFSIHDTSSLRHMASAMSIAVCMRDGSFHTISTAEDAAHTHTHVHTTLTLYLSRHNGTRWLVLDL